MRVFTKEAGRVSTEEAATEAFSRKSSALSPLLPYERRYKISFIVRGSIRTSEGAITYYEVKGRD